MTAPFNRAKPARSPIRSPIAGPGRSARRAPVFALALAGAAIGLPVLAGASGYESPGESDSPVATAPAAGSETRIAGDAATPLRCEIALDAVGSGTEITGTVHSDRPVVGHYQMAITSRSAGGRATIRQSGAFEAGPDAPAILGETRLMGSPASQDVDLTVTINGERLRCGAADL
jgi:hypothetical protein